ncbi:sulfatase [Rhodobacterales bacterium HKCCE2091]|nr:sulfatase [Rhodobacterales bacterium HKCCE2091]
MARVRLTAGLFLSAVLVGLLLIQPNRPSAVTWQALTMKPLELPVLLFGALALGRWITVPAAVVATVLILLSTLKFADLAAYEAFGRSFDPVVDMNLVPAGFRLLSGSIGVPATAAAAAFVVIALVLLGWLVFAGLRSWGRAGARLPSGGRYAAATLSAAFVALSAADVRAALQEGVQWNPPGTAFSARTAILEGRGILRSQAALEEFHAAAEADPWQEREGGFARLDGRDIVIVFIESYGRAAYDNPLYAPRHGETVQQGEIALARTGLAARSGWLTSPVIGGRSWLAHGTLASGLELGDQRRYGAMLTSPRRTLFDIANDAGYHTLAVAPAIVLPWPEGPQFGFREILDADDLGYAGLPFNWVTMPDQYTLAAFERLAPRDAPLLAEIALISSHAPWTPVAEMVPWDDVGDGSIFDEMATAGPTPREVWSDRDSIRDHYGRSLDYSLQAVLSWAALSRESAPLIVVLGDHQAAATISQDGGMDVPVHLIGPPEVLAFFDGWNWSEGLTPAGELPVWPMSAFRDRFLAATSGPGEDRS